MNLRQLRVLNLVTFCDGHVVFHDFARLRELAGIRVAKGRSTGTCCGGVEARSANPGLHRYHGAGNEQVRLNLVFVTNLDQ